MHDVIGTLGSKSKEAVAEWVSRSYMGLRAFDFTFVVPLRKSPSRRYERLEYMMLMLAAQGEPCTYKAMADKFIEQVSLQTLTQSLTVGALAAATVPGEPGASHFWAQTVNANGRSRHS